VASSDGTCSEACARENNSFLVLENSESESAAFRLKRFLKAKNNLTSLLAIRFLLKMLQLSNLPQTKSYTDWDHLERLYTKNKVATQSEQLESQLLIQIANTPGFEQFVTADNYATIKGQMKYNAIAVHDANCRLPYSLATTEIVRGSKDTTLIKGAGLYFVSSYISHSCEPNVSFEFCEGNSSLYVIANKNLDSGTELKVPYVPLCEGRRELIQAEYGFTCKCGLCVDPKET
jgi:import receptor subunit TOM20